VPKQLKLKKVWNRGKINFDKLLDNVKLNALIPTKRRHCIFLNFYLPLRGMNLKQHSTLFFSIQKIYFSYAFAVALFGLGITQNKSYRK
jgi:hypothetical protein